MSFYSAMQEVKGYSASLENTASRLGIHQSDIGEWKVEIGDTPLDQVQVASPLSPKASSQLEKMI